MNTIAYIISVSGDVHRGYPNNDLVLPHTIAKSGSGRNFYTIEK